MGPAAASLLFGFILSGPNQENPIILILLFMSMGVYYLLSLTFIRKIKVRHISFFDHKVIEKEELAKN